MSDADLRSRLIRLAHANPELRKDLLPLIRENRVAALSPAQSDVLRPAVARDLAVGRLSARSAEALRVVLGEAAAYMIGDRAVTANAEVAAITGDLAARFLTRLRAHRPDIMEEAAVPEATAQPRVIPRVLATNSSHYSTDETVSNYDAEVSVDAAGNLELVVKHHHESNYAGGGAPRDEVAARVGLGTLAKPNLGVAQQTLRRFSHSRTSLSNPFSAKWTPWDAVSKWDRGAQKPLGTIVSEYLTSGVA